MTERSPTEQTNALLAAVVASSMDAVFQHRYERKNSNLELGR
jgi:hypothetical protein